MKLITFKKSGGQPILVDAESIMMVEVERSGSASEGQLYWTIILSSGGRLPGMLPLDTSGTHVEPEDQAQGLALFRNYIDYSIRNYY